MSRRPRGPSERPVFYYDPDDLENGEAPRLQGQGLMSKVMVGVITLCCCGILAIAILLAASAWGHILHLPSMPTAAAVGPGAAVVSIEQRPPRHYLQRSVLQRLSLLRRAPAPRRGVDASSVQMAFPHWLAGDGYDTQAVLSDIILALSYLAQEDAERG